MLSCMHSAFQVQTGNLSNLSLTEAVTIPEAIEFPLETRTYQFPPTSQEQSWIHIITRFTISLTLSHL